MIMLASRTNFGFPFKINEAGGIKASGGDEATRSKIIQVLFTAPGERVNQPDFGCGLFNLVFEPNDFVLADAMEFTIGQALARWMGDEIILNAVDVRAEEETIFVELVYTRKTDLSRQMMRVQFQ